MSLVHKATGVLQVNGIQSPGAGIALITASILEENNVSGYTG